MISLYQPSPPTLPRFGSSQRLPLKPLQNHHVFLRKSPIENCCVIGNFDLKPKVNRFPCLSNWIIHILSPTFGDKKYSKAFKYGIELHSLMEQEIQIPLKRVTLLGDDGEEEVLIQGKFYIQVEDFPKVSAENRDEDLITPLVQLLETHLPLSSMIEKLVFSSHWDDLRLICNLSYDDFIKRIVDADDGRILLSLVEQAANKRVYHLKRPVYDLDNRPTVGRSPRIECLPLEIMDGLNKISMSRWGIECLRLEIEINVPRNKILSWGEKLAIIFALIFRNEFTRKRILYPLLVKRAGKRVVEFAEKLQKCFQTTSCCNDEANRSGTDET